jgi:tRNA (pseudouridine54-N1)-methyltransferase
LIEFIVRARAAPVVADRFLEAIGTGVGVEYLADIVRHAIFVSQGHREDTKVTLVLEKSQLFSRVVELDGSILGSLPDLHEKALLQVISDALRVAGNLEKNETVLDDRGIRITAMSFEQLVKSRAEEQVVYVLDTGGEDIRNEQIPEDAVFVMTDHTPMPKNTYKSMARQGVRKLSLGPLMLHAAQCVTIIHNELDRQP